MRHTANSTHQPALYIRKVRGMGRGVFAGRPFRKDEVIEVCPVLRVTSEADGGSLDGELARYVFKWGADGLVIALGYGGLYNHSPHPNAWFTPRLSRDDIIFRALQPIAVGEQILIDYQWDEDDYAGFRMNGSR